MAIYAIGDLHLSFGTNKPMDIFGGNWENHYNKIKEDWLTKVKEEDTVLLLGDFSWAMYLEDTIQDFEYLCSMPGKKLMLKGNHDYWWTTINKMRNFLKEHNFVNIDFIQNNSYLVENKIICGARGWSTINNSENYKFLKRENLRLNLSLHDGVDKYGDDKDIIVCMHYPPFYKVSQVPEEIDFIKTMHNYNVKKCLYGHLHSDSHKEAVEGIIDGIDYKLLSCDYTEFKLVRIV